jgi:hypothetical protein
VAVALTAGAAPAAAQVELSGVWQPRYHEDFPERIPGPELRDYLGLPINDAARQFAESWDPSRITLPEEQCRVHVAPYILRGPTNLRVWVEKDPKTQDVIAIKMYSSTYEQTRTIWMDGRPHPGAECAAHLDGFFHRPLGRRHAHRRHDAPQAGLDSTQRHPDERSGGVHRVHRAQRRHAVAYQRRRRSGVPGRTAREERGVHPLAARSSAQTWLWVCEAVQEIATQTEGDVPAYLPGEHPFKGEFETKHHVPEFAIRGGPETMYPDFQARLREWAAKNPRPAPAPEKK